MKKIVFPFAVLLLLLAYNGCGKSAPSPTGPSGGGLGGILNGNNGNGGNNSSVKFTIGVTQGSQGGILFTAMPSTNVTVNEFTINLPSQNLSDTYPGDGTTVYQGGTVYSLEEYTGVASGQQWSFNFKGNVGSSQGQAYDVTVNYTIP